MKALEIFTNNLPNKPYATMDLEYGLKIKSKKLALKYKYIQHNHPQWLKQLVFDIDKDAHIKLEEIGAKPNIAIFNKDKERTDRAHFVYFIETPNYTGANCKAAPIKYLEAIENAYIAELGADPNYIGLITKNPLHQANLTYCLHDHQYSLGELADYVDLNTQKIKREIPQYSRHINLFDIVRFYAYDIVDIYRQNRRYETFETLLTKYAEQHNQYKEPIKYSQLKAIVRSITRWTWNKYTGNTENINRGRDAGVNSLLTTKEKQTLAAIKTHEQRTKTTEDKIKQAVRQLLAQGKKITQKAVAVQSGLTDRTVREYKHLLK